MLNRIWRIRFLYRNIDIAGIIAVSEVNAATIGRFIVLQIVSPLSSTYVAMFDINKIT